MEIDNEGRIKIRTKAPEKQPHGEEIINILSSRKSATAKEIQMVSRARSLKEIYDILNLLRDSGIVIRKGSNWIISPDFGAEYLDWNNNLAKLGALYDLKIPVLLIGPTGCGKTSSILELAKKKNTPMRSINLSLRSREHHILGRLDRGKGNEIFWKKGPLPLSMEEGSILYLDEINQAEGDVLIRLDECLDDRRQLNYEGQTIIADNNWWVVSSINPLDVVGTKELPQQILSRFPARLVYEYPPPHIELKIIKRRTGMKSKYDDFMFRILNLFNELRRSSDLPYVPGVRESITAARLMGNLERNEIIDMILINPLRQWGLNPCKKAMELAIAKGVYVENG